MKIPSSRRFATLPTIGSLNQRITIEVPTDARDALGQPIAAWQLVATVWADVRHVSGMQTVQADAEGSSVKASIRIRRRNGIDAGMRIRFADLIYDIRAVIPVGAGREFIDIACEVHNGGV